MTIADIIERIRNYFRRAKDDEPLIHQPPSYDWTYRLRCGGFVHARHGLTDHRGREMVRISIRVPVVEPDEPVWRIVAEYQKHGFVILKMVKLLTITGAMDRERTREKIARTQKEVEDVNQIDSE